VALTPDQGVTSGSFSIQNGGSQIETRQGSMFMHSFTAGYSDDELAAIGNFVIGQFGRRQGTITPEQIRAQNASTAH
jgi:hypothetical protein